MRRSRSGGSEKNQSTLVIRKSGYLYRKGKIMRQWRKKYFVLDNWHLRYYHDSKEMQDGSAPNGIISLVNCTVHDGGLSDTFGTKRIHLADGQVGKVHCMSGEDAKDIEEWIQCLKDAVKQRKSHQDNEDDTLKTYSSGVRQRRSDTSNSNISYDSSLHSNYPNNQQKRGHGIQHSMSKVPQGLKKEVKDKAEEFAGLLRRRDAWRLLTVEDGCRVSKLRGSNTYKGSVLINAPAREICKVILDTSSRVEWDPHFSYGSVLEAYGARSQVIRLAGKMSWRRHDKYRAIDGAGTFVNSVSTGLILGLGSAGAAIAADVLGYEPVAGAVIGAALLGASTGGYVGSAGGSRAQDGAARGVWSIGPLAFDVESMAYPRDIVLMQHGIEHERGVFIVPQWSLDHRAAPRGSGFVRAKCGLSGFAIEELVSPSGTVSQVTQIVDFDPCGWVPSTLRKMASMERMSCLSGLREYIAQGVDSDVWGLPLNDGFDDSDDDGAGDGDKGDDLLPSGEIVQHKDPTKTPEPMTWAKCPSVQIFKVRGPHYIDKSHELYKNKVPSKFSMYVPIAVDMFKTTSKDRGIYKRFRKPEGFQAGSTGGVPNNICVTQIFPDYQPSMLSSQDDGPSHNLIVWFTMSDEAKEMLTGAKAPISGINILKEWAKPGDPLHPQWKTIVQVANPEDLDIGMMGNKMIKQYNGKPFLSNVSHTVENDGETIAVISDVHTFGYMLKNFYFNQQQVVQKSVVDMAYVIEGRQADHLPEQILASVRLHNLDINIAKDL